MRLSTTMRWRAGIVALLAVVASLGVVAQPARAQAPPSISWIGGGTIGVRGVAVSPDGQILATAANDHTVKLWRVADRRLVRTLAGHTGAVAAVAFTPDGRFLTSGGETTPEDTSTNVKLWRVTDGAVLADCKVPAGSGNANSVAVSPDGTLLAVGHAGGQVNLFRTNDGALVRSLTGHTDQVLGVAFSPDGATLASASADQTVRIWRVLDGVSLRLLPGHTAPVTSVAFTPDGATLASGSTDRTVRLWRAANFAPIRTLNHTDAVTAVAFSADSQTLASGGGNAGVRLWQAGNGVLLRTIPGTHKHPVSSLTFAGSASLAVGDLDGNARFWRVPDAALEATFGEHTGSIRAVTFSPDGAVFASAGDDTTAKLWRASDGAVVRTLTGHNDRINAIAFSPDGSLTATAAGAATPDRDALDTRINIWRTGDGTLVRTLPGHSRGSTGVAFSADSQTVISTGSDLTLRFWQVSDGTLVREVTNGIPHGVLAISPDRTVIAVLGFKNRAISLFSTADGTLLRVARATHVVNALAFSADGTLLAAGEDTRGDNVQIFQVADAALVRTLPGDPNGPVQGVAFTPDGATLASSSGSSRTIQLWNPATGELRTTLDQETGAGPPPLLPVAFSPDGTQLGFGRSDATVTMAQP